jgi:hypothetical protein
VAFVVAQLPFENLVHFLDFSASRDHRVLALPFYFFVVAVITVMADLAFKLLQD